MRVRNNHCLLKHFFSFEARKVLVNNSPRETLNKRNRCLQTVFSLWTSYIYKMVFEMCNDHQTDKHRTSHLFLWTPSVMVQRLDCSFEKQDVDLVNWKIQESSEGMRYIWTEACSDNAVPCWTIWCIKFLSSEKRSHRESPNIVEWLH